MSIQQRPSPPALRIATFHSDDTPSMLAMLGRCSSATLYQRFHGAIKPGAIVAAQLAAEAAESFVARAGDDCIGVATLSVMGQRAEMGVIVEDAWQRRGAGAALVRSIVRRARELGVTCLRADLLAEHRLLIPRLARIGPVRTSSDRGGYHVEISLGQEAA
jgi:GNAT superfamily N-acetyltransferase